MPPAKILLVVSCMTASAAGQVCADWELQAPPNMPLDALWPKMAFDQTRLASVLFIGIDGTEVGEAWEWNGTNG